MTSLALSARFGHVSYAQSAPVDDWARAFKQQLVRSVFFVSRSDINQIVARCQTGDTAAFRQLFRLYRQDVVQIIHHVTAPSEADLEDLVQDVFLQVHRSIRRFNGRSKFTTWLYRVTVNVVLMHLRAKKSRPHLSDPLSDGLIDKAPEPDSNVMTRQRVDAFYRVLDALPEKQRTVFVLHVLQGMSAAEIGEIVGAPAITVRTRLFYARKQLIQLLNDDPTLAPYANLLERSTNQSPTKASRKKGAS